MATLHNNRFAKYNPLSHFMQSDQTYLTAAATAAALLQDVCTLGRRENHDRKSTL